MGTKDTTDIERETLNTLAAIYERPSLPPKLTTYNSRFGKVEVRWEELKISAMSQAQLLAKAEWLEQKFGPDTSEIIYQFPDGWTIRALHTYGDMYREGELMGNCFSSDASEFNHELWEAHPEANWSGGTSLSESVVTPSPQGILETGGDPVGGILDEPLAYTLYSLRDPDNLPHASIDPSADDSMALGKHNSELKPEYLERIKEWAETSPEVGHYLADDIERDLLWQQQRGTEKAAMIFATGGTAEENALYASLVAERLAKWGYKRHSWETPLPEPCPMCGSLDASYDPGEKASQERVQDEDGEMRIRHHPNIPASFICDRCDYQWTPQWDKAKISGWGELDEVSSDDIDDMYGRIRGTRGDEDVEDVYPRYLYHASDADRGLIEELGLFANPEGSGAGHGVRHHPWADIGVYAVDNYRDLGPWTFPDSFIYRIDTLGLNVPIEGDPNAKGAWRIKGDIPPNRIENLGMAEYLNPDLPWEKLPGRKLGRHLYSSWQDVMEKAKRLVSTNKVQILRNGHNNVVAHVQGDHGDYIVELLRDDPQSRVLTQWSCECPWSSFSWGRSRKWKHLEGRPCAHALAVLWKSQSTPLDEDAGGLPPTPGQKPPPKPEPPTPTPPALQMGMPIAPKGPIEREPITQREPAEEQAYKRRPPEQLQLRPEPPRQQAPPPGVLPPPKQLQLIPPGTIPHGQNAPPGTTTVSVPGIRQPTPFGPIQMPGGTYSAWSFDPEKDKVFEEGESVRLEEATLGVLEGKSEEHGAGQYKEIPKNSIGDVVYQDKTTGLVEAVFVGPQRKAGPMEPYHIRVFLEPEQLTKLPGSRAPIR